MVNAIHQRGLGANQVWSSLSQIFNTFFQPEGNNYLKFLIRANFYFECNVRNEFISLYREDTKNFIYMCICRKERLQSHEHREKDQSLLFFYHYKSTININNLLFLESLILIRLGITVFNISGFFCNLYEYYLCKKPLLSV